MGGIDSSESIPGLPKRRLKIHAQVVGGQRNVQVSLWLDIVVLVYMSVHPFWLFLALVFVGFSFADFALYIFIVVFL
jgi:hypothetical protein